MFLLPLSPLASWEKVLLPSVPHKQKRKKGTSKFPTGPPKGRMPENAERPLQISSSFFRLNKFRQKISKMKFRKRGKKKE
jgi:hypothetical protein